MYLMGRPYVLLPTRFISENIERISIKFDTGSPYYTICRQNLSFVRIGQMGLKAQGSNFMDVKLLTVRIT
jgi:hypothetical protein